MHDLLHYGEVEAPSRHSRQGQDLPGRHTQLLGALVDGIMHAAWNGWRERVRSEKQRALPHSLSVGDLTGGDQRFQSLLNEEWGSLGQRVQAAEQTGRPDLVHAKDSLDHRIDVGTVRTVQG